ncbi:MAG: extracellular solute-binding protein [Candidatus Gastranaerophilales bacterium]|nr:extracellular solute-binding protein [Candidatus Gastranaerophilales bacterium]
MKKLKRTKYVSCLFLCVSLLLTACSKDNSLGNDAASNESAVSNVIHTAQEREWVYVPTVYTVEDGHADYERMQPVGDSFFYVSREEDAGNSVKNICRYILDDGELTSVPINWPEGGNDWDVGYQLFTRDWGLYMTANVYPADSGSMKRFLCKFDLEGNCLFSKDITERAGRNVSLHGLAADAQGRLYIFLDSGEILLYTGDGDYHGSVSYCSPENQEPAQIRGICNGADGKLYVCIGQESRNIAGEHTAKTDSMRCSLMEIDFENARLLEVAGPLSNINGLCTTVRQGNEPAGQGGDLAGGSNDWSSRYDLLLYDDRAVYGYCFDAQKSNSEYAGEELFLWMDSDINGYCVKNLYLLDDGRLCTTVVDWMNDDRGIVALRRTKAEQAPRREELVLATVNGGSDLAAMAVQFNRGNSRYHLTVKSYESLTDLYNAILTKEPMDLIDLSGINVRKLADRGLFEDLAPYVAQSEAFAASDFVDGILDVYTYDNTLVGIPAEFMIQTVVGNRAQMDNKAGLTLEELYSLADRYPEAKAFDGVTKEEMLQFCLMFHEDVFIDWDTGVCRFDSEDFKQVLAYVGQFPDSVIGGREEEKGEVLFAVVETTPYALWDYMKMFEGDAAYVGFPTADGHGGHLLIGSDAYAIAAVSEHKESAWDFIEDSLTQEKSELYADLWLTYPSLKRTLDERVEVAIARDRFTWDDVNAALELVPDATPFFAVDDAIIQIINEEAGAYYSGQKGIDDVVSVIQNRIQVYVDENR